MLPQLEAIIKPAVEALGLTLYGCEFYNKLNRPILLVYVDQAQGVSLQDCERASRQIAAVLDVEDLLKNRYELQVSSPGVERPLLCIAHYERVLGDNIKLKLRQPHQGRRNFVATVTQVAGQQVTLLLEDGETLALEFAQIEKANLVANFLR